MLLVKQCRSEDFHGACLHILRPMFQPLAPPLTQDMTGLEISRQAGLCVLISSQNAGRFAQGREGTECKHVNDCSSAPAKEALKTVLQVLKASGIQSAVQFMANVYISVFRVLTDSGS